MQGLISKLQLQISSPILTAAFNLSQLLKHPTLMDYFLLHNLGFGQTAQNNFEERQQFL